MLKWVVSVAGTVHDVTVAETTLSETVSACLVKKIQAWMFPYRMAKSP